MWFEIKVTSFGGRLHYAFPSAAISRNKRQANQTPLASSSGATFSPSAVLTFTIPFLAVHDPPIARPSNALVISFQIIGRGTGIPPKIGLGTTNVAVGARDLDRENLLWCEFCRPIEVKTGSKEDSAIPDGRGTLLSYGYPAIRVLARPMPGFFILPLST
jgi:hypothetical protein